MLIKNIKYFVEFGFLYCLFYYCYLLFIKSNYIFVNIFYDYIDKINSIFMLLF